MGKVTSKYQVTVPKAIADQYGIRPGSEIEWQPAGDVIRVVPKSEADGQVLDIEERLRLFDEATERQRQRERSRKLPRTKSRGWTREELYTRGRFD